jgi:hypothetical protein
VKQIASVSSLLLGERASESKVKRIMKKEGNLSFKATCSTKVEINQDCFKLKRHYFAKFLLGRLSDGFRIINYDESTIDHFDFTNKCWTPKGKPTRMFCGPVNPRVSLMAAVDNFGNKYMAMSQCNSNRFTTLLFLHQLFELLLEEDPYWNLSSIMIDGAKYHTCIEVKALFRLYQVSYCVTSPNSP